MSGMTDDLVALNDLLVGVEMDRHSLPDGEAKVAALGRAIARLRGEAQAEQAVAFSLRFPDGEVNAMTTFSTRDRAELYAAQCVNPPEVVPLYERPNSVAPAPVAGDAAGVDQRFTEMLLSILNDVQTALGFTDEEKECANGSAEILEAIRDLKLAALAQDRASQAGAPVDTSTNEAWIARAETKLVTQPPAVGVDVTDEMVRAACDAHGPALAYGTAWSAMRAALTAALRTGGGE